MKKVVLASNNRGKIEEFNQFSNNKFKLYTQAELGISAAVENGLSFIENALIKARNASMQCGLAALGDDSGIVVDYLGGKPGIYSARFAGRHGDSKANVAKLLSALKNVPKSKRTARFFCAIAFVKSGDDPCPVIAEGIWEGIISKSARGNNGFGYDPIFYLNKYKCTVAELEPIIKNQLSHRYQAYKKLIAKL